jgi:SAM-dependent methyltransferase
MRQDATRQDNSAKNTGVEVLEEALADRERLTIQLKAELEEERARLQGATARLAAREQQIVQIQSSSSWVLTSPLRAIGRGLSSLGFRKKPQSPQNDVLIERVDYEQSSTKRQIRQYQSIGGGSSSSDSYEKLERLMLARLKRPGAKRPLEGFSVLDIGCNEGFFCNAARELGATRIVGIDRSKAYIELARQRFPDINFLQGSWWDVPEEKFDLVLFLSAIHYEPEQSRLLGFLATRLKPNGTLVLECGVASDRMVEPNEGWRAVMRNDGLRRYPTPSYLQEFLLANYVTEKIGPSVAQRGDPIPRFVFHCTPRRPIALFISGAQNSGKTTLANILRSRSILTYSIDSLFLRLVSVEAYFRSDLSKRLREQLGEKRSWRVAADVIVKDGREREFCEQVVTELPLENAVLFAIEGEALSRQTIRSTMEQTLQDRGIVVWQICRG